MQLCELELLCNRHLQMALVLGHRDRSDITTLDLSIYDPTLPWRRRGCRETCLGDGAMDIHAAAGCVDQGGACSERAGDSFTSQGVQGFQMSGLVGLWLALPHSRGMRVWGSLWRLGLTSEDASQCCNWVVMMNCWGTA